MATDSLHKNLPPYVSYRTFRNFIDGLQQGMPARIDRSYWGDRWSGSSGSQLVAALRFLGLVDSNGAPTSRLRQLASARDAQRTEILKQIASQAFAFLLPESLDAQTATYAQIEELLHKNYHVTADVSRKCIKFFLGLAADAGIPLSPFIIKKSRGRAAGAGTKRTSPRGTVRPRMDSVIPQSEREIPDKWSLDKMLLSKFPTFDPNWTDEVKIKWFDAFETLFRRVLGRSGEEVGSSQ